MIHNIVLVSAKWISHTETYTYSFLDSNRVYLILFLMLEVETQFILPLSSFLIWVLKATNFLCKPCISWSAQTLICFYLLSLKFFFLFTLWFLIEPMDFLDMCSLVSKFISTWIWFVFNFIKEHTFWCQYFYVYWAIFNGPA